MRLRYLTPWIASQEGLALLGQALDIELVCENCEVPVGPFNADILARDLTSNEFVVIENQLERTNHDHFGKTLTYAAVLGAKTIVWIARSFTEEHRKAVEWLNELTKGELSVYGVELQVWRIGQSAPAPRFEIVAVPTRWFKRHPARDAAETSPLGRLQLAFWTEVRESLRRPGEFASLQNPSPRGNFDVRLGMGTVLISLAASSGLLSVRLYMRARVAERVLDHLLETS
jgi:hypothetical protein